MHKRNNSSKTNNNIVSNNESGYVARLRRLKIQEGILSSNMNKSHEECLEICNGNNEYKINKDFKKYLYKLIDSYIDMKNLYEDVKVKTNFHETLEVTDITDLKRDILELEEKIKSSKQFLRKELDLLQIEETSLMLVGKSNDNNNEETNYIGHSIPFTKGKLQTKIYKEIAPSPVRLLIKSPSKCLEIQQFQDFMKNSPNRYGGWNEYNHNVFVQIWNKYNGDVVFTSKAFEDTEFQEFKDEVLQKISGIRTEDITSHIEWYSQYIILKMCQKRALHKWQENRRKIKKPHREAKTLQNICSTISGFSGPVSENQNVLKSVTTNKLNSKTFIKIEDDKQDLPRKLDISRLMRPTAQWMKRCEKSNEVFGFEFNIESISKLRVPTWRLSLDVKEK